MFKRKENRLLAKEGAKKEKETVKFSQRIHDGYVSLVSFGKGVFHRFKPQEKYFAGIAALIIISSLFAIGVQVYITKTSSVPAFGGEYREAVIGVPRFINPVLASTNDVDRDLVHLVYSSLVRYDKNGGIVPDLAEEYTISEDGKQYRFTLKNNLRWEDGTPLTVDDILYTIGLIQNPQYSSPLFQSWQGVQVFSEDSRTVIFELSSPYPAFIENVTLGILPKHIWQDVDEKNFVLTDLNLKPIGSGLYKVEKFTKDNAGFISSYTLVRNERYYNQKPFINKITFKFFSSETDTVKAYNAKSVDGISFISSGVITEMEDKEAFNMHEFKMPRYFSIFINKEKNEALQDLKVRQALSYATNRKQIIDGVLLGYAQEVGTPIPPNLTSYYNESAEFLDYNPEKARELLREAGWEDNNEDGILEKSTGEEDAEVQELSLTLVTAQRPELEQVAQLLQEQWRQVGINLNFKTEELGELQQSTIRSRNYELLMFGEILGTIPDPFSFWHSSQKNDPGLNLANYDNREIDKLLEEARQETNKEARIEKLNEFQLKVTADVPAIFLYDPAYLYPIQKSIRGIEPVFMVDSSWRFADIQNWYIATKRVF
ncbi:MAG: ABC transporter substrate-binding protein [Candidatus Spechtbacterales bacterium]